MVFLEIDFDDGKKPNILDILHGPIFKFIPGNFNKNPTFRAPEGPMANCGQDEQQICVQMASCYTPLFI